MDTRWRDLLAPGSASRLPRETYIALVTRLLRIEPGTSLLEACLVGLIGGLAAASSGDPILWVLCGITSLTVLLLPVVPRMFERVIQGEVEIAQVRRLETAFTVQVWVASAGIGAMAGRALIQHPDVELHLIMIALTLGAAITNLRDHYRPIVPLGKTILLIGPAALAAAATGEFHYQLLALGAVFLGKLILDISLELYRTSLDLHVTLADKAQLVDTLQLRADELQRLRADLLQAARMSAMGTMASALAHELNQPLLAISNYARASRRLLDQTGVEKMDQAKSGMEAAEAAALRAGEIVRRIRSFVSGEKQRRTIVDVAEIVREACAFGLSDRDTRPTPHQITIPRGEFFVTADSIQVQQVVINLVRNAGDALVGESDGRIEIGAQRDGGSVRIHVSDNGPGLADGVEASLFEPFRSTRNEGLGLGLAISRTIVEAHGGRIGWTPRDGGGTIFWFTLPDAGIRLAALAAE